MCYINGKGTIFFKKIVPLHHQKRQQLIFINIIIVQYA